MKLATVTDDPRVETVLLCGSHSRGEWDGASDIDYAVFARPASFDELVDIKRTILTCLDEVRESVSLYSCVAAEAMAARGSLFLWHLRLEGTIQFRRSEWIDRLLRQLPNYSLESARVQLQTMRLALDDIDASLSCGSTTLLFEASLLYAVLRTIGIAVTAMNGQPVFGRLQPILAADQILGGTTDLSERMVEKLLSARHTYSRGLDAETLLTSEQVQEASAGARQLLDRAIRRARDD